MEGRSLLAGLSPLLRGVLSRAGRLAAARDESAYLVGGTVRDLALGRSTEDLDVVVVGKGMAVAQALSRELGGALTRHHAFRTARVDLPDGLRVDVATARGEDYVRPGHLPLVRPGSLRDDLARRDFTINAVALGLNPGAEGELVDPFDGLGDIGRGLIRFLHEGSFRDDPTRMLRGLRFALRFGYRIESRTAEAMADGARGAYLDWISGDRLRREVEKLLGEAPVKGPLELAARGLLAAIHPGLVAERAALERLQSESAGLGARAAGLDPTRACRPWCLVLATLAAGLLPQPRWELVRRLRLSREQRTPLIDSGEPWRRALERITASDPPRLADSVAALGDLDRSAILVGLATLPDERASLREVLREAVAWGLDVRPQLDGAALIALGCREGPRVGELLDRLRRARLEGEVEDVDGERELARRLIAGQPD